MRFSAATGRRTATVRLSSQPSRVACTDDGLGEQPGCWSVTEVSSRAATAVRTIQVGRGAAAVAATADAVVNPPEGLVSRIDPARGVVTATVALGSADGPSEIAVGRDAVWVSTEFRGAVTRIDPEAATIAEELDVGDRRGMPRSSTAHSGSRSATPARATVAERCASRTRFRCAARSTTPALSIGFAI